MEDQRVAIIFNIIGKIDRPIKVNFILDEVTVAEYPKINEMHSPNISSMESYDQQKALQSSILQTSKTRNPMHRNRRVSFNLPSSSIMSPIIEESSSFQKASPVAIKNKSNLFWCTKLKNLRWDEKELVAVSITEDADMEHSHGKRRLNSCDLEKNYAVAKYIETEAQKTKSVNLNYLKWDAKELVLVQTEDCSGRRRLKEYNLSEIEREVNKPDLPLPDVISCTEGLAIDQNKSEKCTSIFSKDSVKIAHGGHEPPSSFEQQNTSCKPSEMVFKNKQKGIEIMEKIIEKGVHALREINGILESVAKEEAMESESKKSLEIDPLQLTVKERIEYFERKLGSKI